MTDWLSTFKSLVKRPFRIEYANGIFGEKIQINREGIMLTWSVYERIMEQLKGKHLHTSPGYSYGSVEWQEAEATKRKETGNG